MIQTLNLDEGNLFIVMKVEDFKAGVFSCIEEWNKKLAEAKRENENKEWYNSRETAKIFNKSTSTINRWKHSGFLTAKTIGGMDYYSKKEINLKMGLPYDN